MKTCWRLAFLALILTTCWATKAWSETRYITDQLVVSLRESPQNSSASITYLKTDTPVKVIEELNDFTKIQTGAGEIGYIKSNYLTKETPKAATIEKLRQERDQLAAEANKIQQQAARAVSQSDISQDELSAKVAAADEEISTLQGRLNESQTELKETKLVYQALQNDSKHIVAITNERDRLQQDNQQLTNTIAKLEKDVGELTKTGVIKWFLAGAGVLFFGWLIGKASGEKRRRSLL